MTTEESVLKLLKDESCLLYFEEIMFSLDLSCTSARKAIDSLLDKNLINHAKYGDRGGYRIRNARKLSDQGDKQKILDAVKDGFCVSETIAARTGINNRIVSSRLKQLYDANLLKRQPIRANGSNRSVYYYEVA